MLSLAAVYDGMSRGEASQRDQVGWIARKTHAVVLMVRAGWHTTGKLRDRMNLTIILQGRGPDALPER